MNSYFSPDEGTHQSLWLFIYWADHAIQLSWLNRVYRPVSTQVAIWDAHVSIVTQAQGSDSSHSPSNMPFLVVYGWIILFFFTFDTWSSRSQVTLLKSRLSYQGSQRGISRLLLSWYIHATADESKRCSPEECQTESDAKTIFHTINTVDNCFATAVTASCSTHCGMPASNQVEHLLFIWLQLAGHEALSP